MKDEILIEQLAEIRALQVANVFIGTMMLEQSGVHSEALLQAIDLLMTDSADRFENSMRKAAGLEPRATPRQPMLRQIDDDFKAIDWSKIKEV